MWTGRPQGDRLPFAGLFHGRPRFRQKKAKAIVEIPEASGDHRRPTAARARGARGAAGRPAEAASHFQHRFKDICAAAMRCLRSPIFVYTLSGVCQGFRFKTDASNPIGGLASLEPAIVA